MALGKLPHFEIPAVRIIVGKLRGWWLQANAEWFSCDLAEICVAARSFSSVSQIFLDCSMKEQFLQIQKDFSGCYTCKKKVNACLLSSQKILAYQPAWFQRDIEVSNFCKKAKYRAIV